MTLTDIHVARWGSGPELILVHGSPQGSSRGGEDHFFAQRPLAEQGWTLLLPDRPGHGRSPSRGPEDMEVDARWVAELLGDGAHLLGHSYGGVIALCAAGLRPEAARSLTMIEASVASVAADDPSVQEYVADGMRALALTDPTERMLAFAKHARIPRELVSGSWSPEERARMGQGIGQLRPPYTWDAGPSIDAVAAAGVPALLVTGGWSPAMEAIADALARRLNGRRLVINAGHHIPHAAVGGKANAPGGEFNETMQDFLTAAEARWRRRRGMAVPEGEAR